MIARSLLYVPGNKPELFAKAQSSGADAVILDLEDAVPPDRKEEAREIVADWLRSRLPDPNIQIWVRVNSGPSMKADADAVARRADGLYVPKVSSPDDLRPLSGLTLTALVETAAGIFNVRAIAGCGLARRLAIGEADLAGETGIRPSPDEREMLPMRLSVVLASVEAGLDAPVGPVSTDFRDLDSLRVKAEAVCRMGFGGMSAIHPAQVPVINSCFTPTEAEVTAARRVLELFEAAGGGVCVGDDGRMIDEPVVRAARRILDRVRD